MAHITYTGVNGETRSFSSNSPDEAMNYLAGIRGYARNQSDEIASGLAGVFGKKGHRANMAVGMNQHSAGLSNSKLIGGTPSSQMEFVKDIKIEKDGIKQIIQRGYMTSDGKFINTGTSERTGKIISDLQEVDVITDLKFSTENGPLKITFTKTEVKVNNIGASTNESMNIGTRVTIHESMSVDRHSYAYVISREADVDPNQAINDI